MPFSQNPKFPAAVAKVGDLFNQINQVPTNPEPTLAAILHAGDTTATLTTGTGAQFPTDNFLFSVENEILFCLSRSGDVFSGVEHAQEGTTAVDHAIGANVDARITAIQHNQAVAEINAIEESLGANLSNTGRVSVKAPPYNAQGIGKWSTGIFITSGQAILTNPSAGSSVTTPWEPSDVGSIILVSGAGVNGADLWSTIASYQSPTQVTLADAASTSVNFDDAFWGMVDDTAAIQAAIDGAGESGLECYIPPGVYLISATLTVDGITPFPPAIRGAGPRQTILVGIEGGVSGGMISFQSEDVQDVSDFNCVGSSLPVGGTPTAGAEVTIWSINSTIENMFVESTSFVYGFHVRVTGGVIKDLADIALSLHEIDGSVGQNCGAAGFVFDPTLVDGILGGVVQSYGAIGQEANPSTADVGYLFTSTFTQNCAPLIFEACASAALGTGFQTIGCTLLQCIGESALIGFLLDTDSNADNCVTNQCTVGFEVKTGATQVVLINPVGNGNTTDLVDNGTGTQTVASPLAGSPPLNNTNAVQLQDFDIDPTPPSDGEILIYDGATQKYVPGDPIVSGPDAVGTAPSRNPVQIGVLDSGGLVREVTQNADGGIPVHVINSGGGTVSSEITGHAGAILDGTAGAPSAGVLTVQGISGGTPQPTELTDGTNGPVAVKPASTAAVNADPALVVAVSPNNTPVLPNNAAKETGGNLSTVAGAVGPSGTPPAVAVSVQGTPGMTAVKVDGSGVTQPVSGSVTVSGTVTANQPTKPNGEAQPYSVSSDPKLTDLFVMLILEIRACRRYLAVMASDDGSVKFDDFDPEQQFGADDRITN